MRKRVIFLMSASNLWLLSWRVMVSRILSEANLGRLITVKKIKAVYLVLAMVLPTHHPIIVVPQKDAMKFWRNLMDK